MAEQSQINPETIRLINGDIALVALEGMTEEQKTMVRKRAAWLADRFIRRRVRDGRLTCDNCGFDPASKIENTAVKARSLLDVHHMNPLDEGRRYTTEADFCLICPNCHRFMHRLARTLSDADAKVRALRPARMATVMPGSAPSNAQSIVSDSRGEPEGPLGRCASPAMPRTTPGVACLRDSFEQ
jgi:5-methylcytosine-specific restriction protein A